MGRFRKLIGQSFGGVQTAAWAAERPPSFSTPHHAEQDMTPFGGRPSYADGLQPPARLRLGVGVRLGLGDSDQGLFGTVAVQSSCLDEFAKLR